MPSRVGCKPASFGGTVVHWGIMLSIKTTAPVGPDGTLTLAVPTPLRETDVEVMVVVHPVALPAERGWPPSFFEATAGRWQGEPLKRGAQGEHG